MAFSDSYDFSVTGGDVVELAFQSLNIFGPGQPIPGQHMGFGFRMLNLLIKNLTGPQNRMYRGMKVWQRATKTLTLTATASFSFRPAGGALATEIPVTIVSAFRRSTAGIDTPLVRIRTREEYDAISNKTAVGTPTAYLYERKVDEGIFTLDFVPKDTTETVVMTVLRPIMDIDNRADDLDFPQEWHLPLARLLAAELAPTYGREIHQALASSGQRAVENANTFSPEDGPLTLFYEPKRDW